MPDCAMLCVSLMYAFSCVYAFSSAIVLAVGGNILTLDFFRNFLHPLVRSWFEVYVFFVFFCCCCFAHHSTFIMICYTGCYL